MTADEKQKICDNIFQYITKKLDDWMDNQIFTKTSMKELGELYYNHVLNEVENADTHLLNAVIRTVKPRNVECITQEDYYIALCKILYFKKLPSEVWTDVERERAVMSIMHWRINILMKRACLKRSTRMRRSRR